MVTGLVLQGGGALGAFELGVIEWLLDNEISPDVVSGVSIGAINAAVLAGSKHGDPRKDLRGLWADLTTPTLPPPLDLANGQMSLFGNPGMYAPRVDYLNLWRWTSFYETGPLRATLSKYVDFDKLKPEATPFAAADPHRHEPGLRQARSLRQPEDGGDGRARRRQRQPPALLSDDHRGRPDARRAPDAVLGRRPLRQHAALQGHRRAGGPRRRPRQDHVRGQPFPVERPPAAEHARSDQPDDDPGVQQPDGEGPPAGAPNDQDHPARRGARPDDDCAPGAGSGSKITPVTRRSRSASGRSRSSRSPTPTSPARPTSRLKRSRTAASAATPPPPPRVLTPQSS